MLLFSLIYSLRQYGAPIVPVSVYFTATFRFAVSGIQEHITWNKWCSFIAPYTPLQGISTSYAIYYN